MEPRILKSTWKKAACGPLLRILAVCALPLLAACSQSPAPQTPGDILPPDVRPQDTNPSIPVSVPKIVSAEVVLLGTTDVHNRLYPYDYYTNAELGYGLARLKPIIDSIRATNPGRTLLFDSGDLLQGNPLGFVYARQRAGEPNPVITAMNLLAYDAAAIGNHEYNYGIPHLEKAVREANFRFVSGNTFQANSTEHAFAPYVLIPRLSPAGDTILIGVTGNTPPGVHVWDRANVEGKLEFRDVVTSLRPIVREMRQNGADVVVVLSHGGFSGSSYDTIATGLPAENAGERLAREVPGIDVVFLGHTHQELADSTINGVMFTQAKNWAQSLAEVKLVLERQGPNDWRVAEKRGSILKPLATRADTAFLDSLRWQHERVVEYVNAEVGTSAAAYNAREARTRDVPIIDFINEVQRRRTGADLSSTAAFSLNSAIPAGSISIADLAGLYVYDNTLKVVRINGAQLKAYLEKSAEYFSGWPAKGGSLINPNHPGYNFDVVSGVDYTIDVSKPVGQRITVLKYQGRDVRPDQSFTLALNNYRQSGGGGFSMLANAPVVYDQQEDIRELLIEDVRRRGRVDLKSDFRENWRLEPAAARTAIQNELAREVQTRTQASAPVKRLRVIGTNDFHGRLQPERYNWTNNRTVGGAAALATYFRHEANGFVGPTIHLNGGDMMQGTPISNLTQGRSSIDFYNLINATAAAIGNHEFDWSVPILQERMKQSKFPWLGANIFVEGTDTMPSWARDTVILELQGVKVGIIGLATEETPHETKGINVRGLEFRDGASTMDRLVPALRQAGADFVLVVAHSGAVCDANMTNCRDEMVEWAKRTTQRPDLIVAGHTHQTINTIVNGIRITEAWDYGKRYSVIDLQKNADGSTQVWVRGQPISWTDQVARDTAAAQLVRKYEAEIGPRVSRVITTMAEPLLKRGGDYPLGRLIADAQRAAAGAQLAIMNNGGIRTELPAGEITWGALYQLQPFENRLVRLTLTGAQIREVMEQVVRGSQPGMHISGFTVQYDPQKPEGSRVVRMLLPDGSPIRNDVSYTMSVNDFLAGGGDGLGVLTRASKSEDLGIVDLDALIDYMQKLPQPVRAPAEPRFTTVPAASNQEN